MNPNRLRLTTKQLSSSTTTITLAMTMLILSILIMNQIQPNYAGPLAEMQAFRLGQSLTRQPITIWRRVFYPFPVNVVEKKYVPVKIPIPVYVKPPPPSPPSYQPSHHHHQQYQSSNQSPRYYYQTPILTATNNYQSYY
ncbi:hypothetical protein DERP_005337 [Dermatophagoides pteronyssinus]|uniref:Uncharacterized protein n=1 Tax=Dermatophagoides pteronyssinus TaxID=6956 RepID=A0ABQ8JMC4_DERPT|nr:hypothetical protein DERP_005337 [Dermatophagoides pteronyssinus]